MLCQIGIKILINGYVAGTPITTGTMSWLYNGYTTTDDTREEVAIKIGFDEALQNPLYRACFEIELHLFETLSHPCLPDFRERIGDVVNLDAIQGNSLLFQATFNAELGAT